MAKGRKSSPGSKNDMKTTIIIVLLMIVGIQAFLLFNRDKSPSKRVSVEHSSPVKKKPVVTKAPKQPSKAPAAVVPVAVRPAPTVSKPVPTYKKAPPGSAGKIAFVLDDWGYTTRNCKYLKAIKPSLAIAILPNLKHTDDIIQCAGATGKEIMLHLPLEPYNNKDTYPEDYLITTQMKPAHVTKILLETLSKMPQIQGVNNHMGSKATEDKDLMRLIFKQLKKRNLFFVDSMTSPHHSVCGDLAAELQLPFAQRDVFLDNINTKEEIEKQITILAQKARKKGSAIAIGHDRELTLQVLQEQIPILEDQGFEIVRVKDLLKR